MELATIFLIWLTVTIIDNMASRKKRRLPSPEFDTPPPEVEVPIFIESPRPVEVHPHESQSKPKAAQVQTHSEESKPLKLTAQSARNAFVLSEILGKPKALRRR